MKRKVKVGYTEYICSKDWLEKHPKWLRSFGRCSAFLFIPLGKSDDGYRSYNIHHIHYKTLGRERLWWDVVPLSLFAHHHIFHGVLSFYKRPSDQRTYPNLLQRVFHAWCRLMILIVWLRWLLLPVVLFAVWGLNQGKVLGFVK